MVQLLIPEFAVSDWLRSKQFYCGVLGFTCLYERPEEGFAHLDLDGAGIMIDQISLGRSFDGGHAPGAYPFGRGVNLQIECADVLALHARLEAAGHPIFLPLEDRWYRVGESEEGNRQFMTADPDGYLLRFFQDIGTRPLPGR